MSIKAKRPFIQQDLEILNKNIFWYEREVYLRVVFRARGNLNGFTETTRFTADEIGISHFLVCKAIKGLLSQNIIKEQESKNKKRRSFVLTDPEDWVVRKSPTVPKETKVKEEENEEFIVQETVKEVAQEQTEQCYFDDIPLPEYEPPFEEYDFPFYEESLPLLEPPRQPKHTPSLKVVPVETLPPLESSFLRMRESIERHRVLRRD